MRTFFLFFVCVFFVANSSYAITFDTTEITILKSDKTETKLTVELADTPTRQAHGLMYRTDLGANSGMLFVFHKAREISMWMANTPLSLDMIFIDSNGIITEIFTNTEPYSYDRITSAYKTKAVLELNANASSRLNIKIGDKVVF